MNAMRNVPVALIVIAAVTSACGLPQPMPLPTSVPTLPPPVSATPYQPLPPTDTPIPTSTITPTPSPTPTPVDPWENFAGPTEPSAIEIPRPMPSIEFPEEVVNIALLGSDQRPPYTGTNTDTIIIASLNPEAGTVTLISIPRDLYVYIPGWRVNRINTAFGRGGEELFATTILYNTGIRVDHWAIVNFAQFVRAVDALGGIDVPITRSFTDKCGIYYTYTEGTTEHMDGWTALCYVRMRRTLGDLDRMRRAQEVLAAIFKRVVTLEGLSRVDELYTEFSGMVGTDMELGDILPLISLAIRVASDTRRIRSFSIDSTMVTPWMVPSSGANVLLPEREAIAEMLAEAFGD